MRTRQSLLWGAVLVGLLAAAGETAPATQLTPFLHFDVDRFKPLSTEGLRVVRDVPYYTGPGADQQKHRLDLYLPPNARNAPVVVFVHGGGWIRGDRNYVGGLYGNVGTAYARGGIAGVILSYRLSPGVKHPAHVQDVARALHWVQDHIAEYGGDPNRVFVSGHSAGGHLAALVTLDTRYLKAEGLAPTFIKGALPMSGVYNLDRMARSAVARRLMLEPAFGSDPQQWAAASPLTYVRPDAPPFFLVNAQRDASLPLDTRELERALRRAGVQVSTFTAPDTNHGTVIAQIGHDGDPTTPKLIAFVKALAK